MSRTSVILLTTLLAGLSPALAASNTAPASKPAAATPVAGDNQLYPAPSLTEKQESDLPINIARLYLGATISVNEDKKWINAETDLKINGLIRDDDSFRYDVPAGKTVFIIGLPQNTLTNRCCFVMEGTEGTARISGSSTQLDSDSKKWQVLADKVPIKDSYPLSSDWAWTDMKYLKVEFDLKQAGRLGSFGLFGAPKVKDVKVTTGPGRVNPVNSTSDVKNNTGSKDGLPSRVTEPINVASIPAKGRVSYVSSGLDQPQSAVKMIDNDVATQYTFDKTDPDPTLVVQLSEDRPIRRISAYYDAPPGVWEVYPMNGLPGEKTDKPTPTVTSVGGFHYGAATPNGIGSMLTALFLAQTSSPQLLHLPADFFKDNHAAMKLEHKPGEPYGVAEFASQKSRVVLFHWVPDPSNPANGKPIRVFQISIFVDPEKQWPDALPDVDFASLGATGVDTGTPPIPPPPFQDPPQVVSP